MSNLILPPGYSSQSQRVRTEASRPQRNEARETTVRTWLQEIDPLLDVEWFEELGLYGFIVRWPMADPRWLLIRSGEIGNAPYDILGWAAEDMQDGNSKPLAVDEIENKVLALLASADNSKQPWKDRLKSVAQKNVELRSKRRASFIDQQVHDLAEYHRNEALGIHQVSVPTEIK